MENKYEGLINVYVESFDDYKQLCIYAFDVIILTLKKLSQNKLQFPLKFKHKTYPLFVTWSKGEEKSLRGCIGTFSSDDVEKNLMIYSYYAAFKDNRFSPISILEIPSLHCGISLLVEFEEGSDAFDWELGKHGISIEFLSEYRNHHATFLPEIPSDRKWDKKTTLKQLVQKSGYYGRLDDILNKIKLTRYQSIKVGISHCEYKIYKKTINDLDFIIN